MKNFYKNKSILVTGGTGLIGSYLVSILIKKSPKKIRIVSMDKNIFKNEKKVEFLKLDLRYLKNCEKVCENIDIVFNLTGVTGSPAMTYEKPGTFLVNNILLSFNLLEAAKRKNIKNYLYTSSYGVYGRNSKTSEQSMWGMNPSEADRYAGWAKRMGELQAEAYKIEHRFKNISVVRPANVYGPGANFDPKNSMVVSSVIKRAVDGQNPLVIWGDGTPIRDFIHAKDVAIGMLKVMEKKINYPINLGSGKGISIKKLVNIIVKNIQPQPKVIFDKTKPNGDPKRVLNTTNAKKNGIKITVDFEKGIKETVEWYKKNKNKKNFNAFKEI